MNLTPRGLSFTDAQRGGETSRARKEDERSRRRATKGAGPDQGLSWEAEHRPSEPLSG